MHKTAELTKYFKEIRKKVLILKSSKIKNINRIFDEYYRIHISFLRMCFGLVLKLFLITVHDFRC